MFLPCRPVCMTKGQLLRMRTVFRVIRLTLKMIKHWLTWETFEVSNFLHYKYKFTSIIQLVIFLNGEYLQDRKLIIICEAECDRCTSYVDLAEWFLLSRRIFLRFEVQESTLILFIHVPVSAPNLQLTKGCNIMCQIIVSSSSHVGNIT